MRKHWILWTYVVLVLFTIAPFLSVLLASLVAQFFGTQVDEGSAHQCMVLGFDIGPVLYAMLVSGWLMIVTIPVGVIAIMVFTGILIAVKLIRDFA